MTATRFLIAAFPRTGSNWLCSKLDAHPDVRCHYEALHPGSVYLSPAYASLPGARRPTVEERDRDPRAFVRWLYEGDGHAAVGFKTMWGQQPEVTEELLVDPSVVKIVLRRENRVRVFVSARRATATGAFAFRNYDDVRLHVDADELTRFVADYDGYFRWVDETVAGQDVEQLAYETLFEPARLDTVFERLHVSPVAALESSYVKQSNDSLRAAIANFDELADALAGTPLLEQLLSD